MVYEVTLNKQVLMTNGKALTTKEDILEFCKAKPDAFFIFSRSNGSFLVCSYCSTKNNLKAVGINNTYYTNTINILLSIPHSNKADISNVYEMFYYRLTNVQYLDGWWNTVVNSKCIKWTEQYKKPDEDTLKI